MSSLTPKEGTFLEAHEGCFYPKPLDPQCSLFRTVLWTVSSTLSYDYYHSDKIYYDDHVKSVYVITIKNINISWIITLVYPLHAAQFTLIQSVSHTMSDVDRKELVKELEAMSDPKNFSSFSHLGLSNKVTCPHTPAKLSLCASAKCYHLMIYIFPWTS